MADFVAIVGPTAAGKSALALRLAEAVGGELVSADAFQVYRGLDLGTAKPTPVERARVRHHLVDILDPRQPYSAGEFARRGAAAIAEVRARGRLPIVVGGSGLYLRALRQGLSPLPSVPPAVREQWRRSLAAEGLAALRRELERRDPETAARLASADTQRTLRALEVHTASGVPLSHWLRARPAPPTPLRAAVLGLTLPRPLLYDRIGDRLRGMLAGGWVAEVEGLLASGLTPAAPAFRALGYRELARHLAGEVSLAGATAETARATRRYAKRQETWFRGEDDIRWLAGPDPDWNEVRGILEV